MQKVNVDVHIWNELRSSDQFGFKSINYNNYDRRNYQQYQLPPRQ